MEKKGKDFKVEEVGKKNTMIKNFRRGGTKGAGT